MKVRAMKELREMKDVTYSLIWDRNFAHCYLLQTLVNLVILFPRIYSSAHVNVKHIKTVSNEVGKQQFSLYPLISKCSRITLKNSLCPTSSSFHSACSPFQSHLL